MMKKILSFVIVMLLISASTAGTVSTFVYGERPPGKYGGTLTIPVNLLTASFTPNWMSYGLYGLLVMNQIYSKLVSHDFGIALGVGIQADLARSWDASPDGLTYTFNLAQNVTWHDGTKFTSADVKYTYEYIIENQLVGIEDKENIQAIETPDDYTVKITLNNPNQGFLAMLAMEAHMQLYILPKHIYDGTDWKTNPHGTGELPPIGTGPFKFEELVKGSHISMVANEEYFLGRPYLDKMILRLIPERATAVTLFKAGELQVLYTEMAPEFPEIVEFQKDPDIKVFTTPWTLDISWLFNAKRTDTPFSDPRVRRAMAYVIDREDLIQKAWYGFWNASYTIAYPGLGECFNPDVKYPPPDKAAAEALLDSAGYPRGADGVRFGLEIIYTSSYTWMRTLGEIIKEELRGIGITVSLATYDTPSLMVKLYARDFDTTLFWLTWGFGPAYGYNKHFVAGGSRNFMGYNNSRVNELLQLGKTETDVEKHKSYYLEVQEIITEEMPTIPLAAWTHIEIVRKGWHGTRQDPEYWDLGYNPGYGSYSNTWWEGAEEEPTPGPAWYEQWWTYAVAIIIVVLAVAVAIYYTRRRARRARTQT